MIIKKYVTNIFDGIYFNEEEIEVNKCSSTISKKQKWLGMGGAITQSVGYNYLLLSDDKRKEFIKDYFEELNYKWVRLPIASCDFSPKSYVYTNKKDLSDFNINYDNKYLLPILKDINKYDINYLATPWTPPRVFKTIPFLCGGKLNKKYYESYGNYFVKYINTYKDMGINIKYITIQNEVFAKQIWESCTFSIDEQKEFIKVISEIFKNNNINSKIILWDHNKDNLFDHISKLYDHQDIVDGIGFHWYTGSFFDELKRVSNKYSNLLKIETELCCGFSKYNEIEWINKGELYLEEAIGNINSGMNVFIDWNMLLNYNGGPNHKNNYCAAPIILNQDNSNYIKTPIYYYLKHLSMIPINSYVVEGNSNYVSFVSDNTYTIVLNNSDHDKEVNIDINGYTIKDIIKKHSIIAYKK